jgi:hypothetical protein
MPPWAGSANQLQGVDQGDQVKAAKIKTLEPSFLARLNDHLQFGLSEMNRKTL